MKKLLYILTLFILKSQAQTHNFSPSGSNRNEVKAPGTVFYFSKASGELNSLSSWGSNPDGSGSAPASFSCEAIFKICNRKGDVALAGNWTVSNIEIGQGIKLVLGSNTLVVDGGTIAYEGDGKLKGSAEASVMAENNERTLTLTFDNSVPGSTNALKSLKIHSQKKPSAAGPVTFGSDIHIYDNLTLHSGDLIVGNHNICLKSNPKKEATFQTPGIYENGSNVLYDGSGRFVLEHVNADGKSITTLIAQPFTETAPVVSDDSEASSLGCVEESRKTADYISKNLYQDDIKLFLSIKFLDFYTKVNLDPLCC